MLSPIVKHAASDYNRAMNIAVFGGTFDPPHFGHLLVARQVLEAGIGIDEVWLLPANTNPDKQIFAQAHHRLAMARLLAGSGIGVSDIDIARGGDTYTKDTAVFFEKDTQNKFFWVIGSDLVSSMKKWQGYEYILQTVKLIIFPRPEYPIHEAPESAIVLGENKLLTANYSSTVIRARVAQGRSIAGLVPEKVEAYIKKNQLYQTKSVYV